MSGDDSTTPEERPLPTVEKPNATTSPTSEKLVSASLSVCLSVYVSLSLSPSLLFTQERVMLGSWIGKLFAHDVYISDLGEPVFIGNW